jgi:hypothetical protein
VIDPFKGKKLNRLAVVDIFIWPDKPFTVSPIPYEQGKLKPEHVSLDSK